MVSCNPRFTMKQQGVSLIAVQIPGSTIALSDSLTWQSIRSRPWAQSAATPGLVRKGMNTPLYAGITLFWHEKMGSDPAVASPRWWISPLQTIFFEE